MISQNGWPVLLPGADLAPVVVRGVALAPGVRPSIAPLVRHFCNRLADIEPPHDGWCWGWAYRPIRGKTSGFSNHASGTAWDWNAPSHPRGDVRTAGFTSSQAAAIRRLLLLYDGAIRWGADYREPPYDGMHFELNDDPAAVARVIDRLKGDDDMDVAELRKELTTSGSPSRLAVFELARKAVTVEAETQGSALRVAILELTKRAVAEALAEAKK